MPVHKRSFLVFLLLGLGIFGGSIYGFSEQERTVTLDAGQKDDELTEAEITVYVCGAVNKPGIIRIAAEARVIDAVNLCGGPLPTADVAKINMAQTLQDGGQITVPEKLNIALNKENAPTGETAKAAGNSAGKININTADQAELDKLPGIGPVMAAAIIEYRTQQGAFQTLDDLKKVRGIGEAKYQKLKDKATL